MSVLVAGALHLDVVLQAPHLPTVDETVTGSEVAYVFGGKGGNQALAAARLGAQVAFAGRAGADAFGDMLRAGLEGSGINLTALQRDPGPSGMSAAIVDASGDYGAVIVSAANLNLDAQAVDIAADVSVLVLQNEVPEAVNATLAAKAKARGAQVWLNAAPARTLPAAVLKAVDLLIVNRVEAAFYAQTIPPAQMLTTLGADGARFQGQSWPAYPVDVVSSHGAGDVFVGALAAEVDAGRTLEQAIPYAQAAAAWHVSVTREDRAHLSRARIEAFLNAQPSR